MLLCTYALSVGGEEEGREGRERDTRLCMVPLLRRFVGFRRRTLSITRWLVLYWIFSLVQEGMEELGGALLAWL